MVENSLEQSQMTSIEDGNIRFRWNEFFVLF